MAQIVAKTGIARTSLYRHPSVKVRPLCTGRVEVRYTVHG